jgi:hypothetical protein
VNYLRGTEARRNGFVYFQGLGFLGFEVLMVK